MTWVQKCYDVEGSPDEGINYLMLDLGYSIIDQEVGWRVYSNKNDSNVTVILEKDSAFPEELMINASSIDKILEIKTKFSNNGMKLLERTCEEI